jgi:hypothetical protein
MKIALRFGLAVAGTLLGACGAIAPDSLFLAEDDAGSIAVDVDAGPSNQRDAAKPPRDASKSVDARETEGSTSVACEDSQNGGFAPDTNCSGTSLAWAYTPQRDLDVRELELHATGGVARIFDSAANGRPGKLLFEGNLPTSPTPQFLGAIVNPPLHLTAGHKYFIGKSEGICSIASGGEEQEYYAGYNGSWDGPWKSHHFTARLYGTCD